MAARSKPIQKFGPYLLFKELETDSLGQTWRAGRIDGTAIAATVVLRRLSGGDRDALRASAESAAPLIAQVSGSTIVKNQRYFVIDGIPIVEFEYATGRSLRAIVDRARGTAGGNATPIPVDQVLAIVEKVAASMEAMANYKGESGRLLHGAVVPQSIWITESGDVRVSGQLLGGGLVRSLGNAKTAAEFSRYVAPEIRATAEPTKASEVYAAGALLYLMLTTQEPPDALNREEFDLALARPLTLVGKHPLPDDIRPILQKALAIEPSHRYPSVVEFRQEINRLLASGAYAPTTFNLAFYLHSILKKEFEAETAERERESKVNVQRYVEQDALPPMAPVAPFQAQAEAAAAKPKSKLGLIAAAVALVAIGGGFAVWKFALSKPAAAPTAAVPAPQQAAAALPILEPIVATTTAPDVMPADTAATVTDTTAAPTATMDPEEARKKLIEAEIAKRFQQELIKLQADADRERQQQEPAARPQPAPPVRRAAAEPVREELPAAALDQARRAQTATAEPPPTATVATATQAPPVAAPAIAQPPAAEPAAVAQVREGDYVPLSQVDQMPRVIQTKTPVYPPLAMRQKIPAQVIASAYVSENGIVLDVKMLRGDRRRLGFDEAAINAARHFTFAPAIKDGKRVKTWVPIPFEFKLQ